MLTDPNAPWCPIDLLRQPPVRRACLRINIINTVMDPQNPSGSAHSQQNRAPPVYDTAQGGHYGEQSSGAFITTLSQCHFVRADLGYANHRSLRGRQFDLLLGPSAETNLLTRYIYSLPPKDMLLPSFTPAHGRTYVST